MFAPDCGYYLRSVEKACGDFIRVGGFCVLGGGGREGRGGPGQREAAVIFTGKVAVSIVKGWRFLSAK
jgi:hypothetical protein